MLTTRNNHMLNVMPRLNWPILSFVGLTLLATYVQTAQADGAKKIVKWKDDKGVTHYGDVLPSQDSGRGNAVLNKEGVVIQKNDTYTSSSTNKDADKAYADQVRQDSALLASYSSVEEIDLAQERNVQTEKNILQNLRQRQEDTRASQAKKQALADGYRKKHQPIPSYLVDEIKANQTKMLKTETEITSTENNVKQIQVKFATYKARYVELRPRNQALTEITAGKKNLSELEAWKKEANDKLSYYLNETVKYKRTGAAIPSQILEGIQQSNQEIARADQEIAAIKANIKNSQETFSK